MISALLVVMMQAGGAYTHLPKLTLFPSDGTVKALPAEVRCSVHMPRMAVPKDVEFHIGILKPQPARIPTAVLPAPECKAPESK